jgi:hypothetical protein
MLSPEGLLHVEVQGQLQPGAPQPKHTLNIIKFKVFIYSLPRKLQYCIVDVIGKLFLCLVTVRLQS